MAETQIRIGADGIDAEAIVKKIRERADARRASGEFNSEDFVRAERYNLSTVKDDADFFDRYLACLCLISQVDINDFEIVERRARFSGILRRFKKAIWSVLKFYTYHLWSQQNQVNSVFNAALELVARRDSEQLAKMQARVDELEERLAALEAGQGAATQH